MDAHVSPPPTDGFKKVEKPTADHPFLAWHIRRHNVLAQVVQAYTSSHAMEIEALPEDAYGQHVLGEVSLEVLGHPCRWIQASCIPVSGSFLGEVVLEAELAELAEFAELAELPPNAVRFKRQ
jgi:hypothetical protein